MFEAKAILVTGGAGFIGSNFVRQLCRGASGPRIVNLDKLTYAGNLENLVGVCPQSYKYTFVEGDILDRDLVSGLLAEHEIDAIVHFAAETHVDRSIDGPEAFAQTNLIGTLRLLEAARDHWTRHANFRFLHVSTDEVYGSLGADDPAFSETTPYAPNSPYAASKAGADHLVRAWHHTYGLPTLITNCSNNYGPYQFPEKLIPLMILTALEEKPLPIYGDGSNVRDWLFVRDHCLALQAVLAKGRPGEVYNIGGHAEMTNLQVVDTLCRELDRLVPRANGKSYGDLKSFVTDRPGHDHRYAIDTSKIEREIGWRPTVDFAQGLHVTTAWYLAQQDWCNAIHNRRRLGDQAAHQSAPVDVS